MRSKPLDELREMFEARRYRRFITPEMQSCNMLLDDILDDLSDFEAAHPGLVDLTGHCQKCGLPLDLARLGPEYASHGHCFASLDGCGGEAVEVIRDVDWGPIQGYLCPACAAKGKGT